MTFHAGDKIRQKEDCNGAITGEIYELTWGDKGEDDMDSLFAWKGGKLGNIPYFSSGCNCQEKWELVELAKNVIIHPQIPIITSQQFLSTYQAKVADKIDVSSLTSGIISFPQEKYTGTFPCEFIGVLPESKKETKKMSIIKNIFKTTEQKALAHYGITNGDGGLTETGRVEFVDYIYHTDKEIKEGFIKEIINEYKKIQKESK